MACKSDNQNITQKFLTIVDDGNLTLLRDFLAENNHIIDVNATNKHGESGLHIAAGYGKLEVVKELYKNGANLDATDKLGDTPMYWAARNGHNDVVQFFCRNNVSVNHRDKTGETALHVASRYGHPDVLQSLITYQANVDLQDNDGDTPLLCGCWHGLQNIVEILVQSGASVFLRNDDGDTPLHVAAVRGNYSIVRYLCEHGRSEMNSVNKNGHSPLYLATKRNHLDIVQYFCEHGCNLNLQDKNGNTPLHEASREGLLSLVYTLFAAQCNLDIQNNDGQTPLYLAATNGHSDIVRCLCSGGCFLDNIDNEGQTVDQAADATGYNSIATMLQTLRQEKMRDRCLSELKLGRLQVDRVRLLVCGAAGVGKTSLISSLKNKFFRNSRNNRCGNNYFGAAANRERTHGFCVEQCSIPGAGCFSIWDFSGHYEYYPAHEYFLQGASNLIYLIVCCQLHSYQYQLAQVKFWLAMIKSKFCPHNFIQYAGHRSQKPFVVLVQSFADRLPSLLSHNESDTFDVTFSTINNRKEMMSYSHSSFSSDTSIQSTTANQLLKCVEEEFGQYFIFTDKVFNLDCRKSRGSQMQLLRLKLGLLRLSVLKEQPWLPRLTASIQHALSVWRQELKEFPVMTWENFLCRVQEDLNPLITSDRLRIIAKALNSTGEIAYIPDGHLKNLIVLDPDWLGQRIFGSLLAADDWPVPCFHTVTGAVSLNEIQRVYEELDALSVVHLLEHFEMCIAIKDRNMYEIPLLIKMEPLYGLWEKELQFTIYAGLRLETSSQSSIFSPGLFPRAQIHIRKMFIDDNIEMNQDITSWTNGLKYSNGQTEVYLRQVKQNSTIEILVRGDDASRNQCCELLKQFHDTVTGVINNSNPSTNVNINILSSWSMMEHWKEPLTYTSLEIFNAERTTGILTTPGYLSESICDLLCCGCKEMEITAQSAPYTSIRDIPLRTRIELCRMLDPLDPFGRDWCLLALQLGIQDEVSAIDNISDARSPTDRLLAVWNDKNPCDTVVTLVDALIHIGRLDAAKELVNGLSPFHNPNYSIIMNIEGFASTSFAV
jgi:death-associated protein kinase